MGVKRMRAMVTSAFTPIPAFPLERGKVHDTSPHWAADAVFAPLRRSHLKPRLRREWLASHQSPRYQSPPYGLSNGIGGMASCSSISPRAQRCAIGAVDSIPCTRLSTT